MRPHILALALLLPTISSAQSAPTRTMIAGRSRVAIPAGTTSTPLLPGSRPVIAVTINGSGPFRMLVETGSPVSYLLAPAFARAFPAGARDTDSLRIGDAILTGVTLSSISTLTLPDIDGLLGLDALYGATVTWDFPNRTLRLRADTLAAANGRDILALSRASVFWSVPIVIGEERIDAILDTQSALSLSAAPSRARTLQFTTEPVTVGRARGPTIGDVPVQRARLANSARLGDAELLQPLIDLLPLSPVLPQDAFILGLQVLSEFSFSLDQRTGRARFERESRRIAAPGPVYVTGLGTTLLADRTRRVTNVISGSAASEAGLTSGDLIVAVNGRAMTDVADAAWRALVSGSASIEMRVRRDGSERTINLTPRSAGF